MEKTIYKNNAKLIIDFQLNATEVKNGKTTLHFHTDGKFNLTAEQLREVLRATVSGALKGASDALDEKELVEEEENIE